MKVIALAFLMVFLGCISAVEASYSPPIGYEMLANNTVVHIWNTNDNYYFDVETGLQFTNHYNEYWSRNVFCGGVDLSPWKYYCTDELPFTWDIETDNSSFVNITGFRVISQGPYTLRLAIRYHLGLNDKNLTIQGQIKNLGPDIPVDLAFAWRIKDIKVAMREENNTIGVGWKYVYPLHNDSLDELYTALPSGSAIVTYEGEDDDDYGEWLGLFWNNGLNYALQVKAQAGQYNTPVTLAINAGPLASGQVKETTLYWKDAACSGVWAFYSEVPETTGRKYADNYTVLPKLACGSSTDCPVPEILGSCYNAPEGSGYLGCDISYRTSTSLGDPAQTQNTSWENSGWNILASSTAAENCDLYTEIGPNHAVYTGYELDHNNFTDFRCRVRIFTSRYSEEFEIWSCIITVKGNNQIHNAWGNNNSPQAHNVTITPPDAETSDDLTCSYEYYDADGDAENTSITAYDWLLFDVAQGIANPVLLAGNTSDGDNWTCAAKVFDQVFITTNETYNYSAVMAFPGAGLEIIRYHVGRYTGMSIVMMVIAIIVISGAIAIKL